MRDRGRTAWNELKDGIVAAYNTARDTVFNPMNVFVSQTIPQKWTEMKNAIIRTFSEVRDTIGRIWIEMISAAKSAVNTLGGFVNKVIDAINKIPFVKDKLPHLPGFEDGGAIKKAHGGEVSGGRPGTDTVPAMSRWGQRYLLDNGEHILTRKDVNVMGGQRAVYAFRRMLHHGYWDGASKAHVRPFQMATGGRVGPENNSLLEAHRDHVHVAMNVPPMGFPLIIAKAASSGIPHSVGSTFRPGSRGSGGGLDHHSEGRAVDFPGYNQDRFASFWEATAGVIELIHRTNTRDYAIFGGGGGGLISFLMTAAGKLIKAAFDNAMKVLRDFIGGNLLKGDTVAPTTVRGLFDNVSGQLENYFNEMAGMGGGAATPEQLKGWITEAQKYVNIEWIEGLVTLIMRESGGNPRAINLTDSNAAKGTPSKGLMQTIDPTFRAYRDSRLPNDPFDPVANIVAGMNYVHARYGSLRNVQQAHAELPPKGYEAGGAIAQAFDKGGALMPGPSLVRNLTGHPEAVLNPEHAALVGRVLAGDGLYIENHLYIDGEPIRAVSRQEIQTREAEVRREELIGKRP